MVSLIGTDPHTVMINTAVYRHVSVQNLRCYEFLNRAFNVTVMVIFQIYIIKYLYIVRLIFYKYYIFLKYFIKKLHSLRIYEILFKNRLFFVTIFMKICVAISLCHYKSVLTIIEGCGLSIAEMFDNVTAAGTMKHKIVQ